MQPLPLRSSSQGQALAQVFSLRANWYNPLLGLLLIGILGLGIGLGLDRLICQWNPTRCDRSPARFVESIPDSGVTTLKSVETLPGVWRYSGSTAWAAIRKTVDQAIRQAHPDFKLTYISHPTQPPGSGMGIQMVLNGQLSFAQSSRPLEDQEYKMAEQRGFQLKQIPVAIDGIVVVVHPDLAVKGLTLAQLTNIYTGKITNWGEVGGPDLPIVLYASPKGSGSPMFMQQNLFAPGETFSPNLIRINTPTEAINKIGRDRQSRGGIYMATATNLVGQCLVKPLPLSFQAGQEFVTPYLGTMASPTTCLEQPNQINHQAFRIGQYPLTRRLFVIIKQDSQLDQKAGEIYTELLLTDEGQRLIQESGFTPIRSPAAENSRFNSIKTIQIPELLLRSIIP
ncbi:MAG: phosphate ABC transporter substrate-binding protein [Oscillatoriales cyanobacterium RM1_1_9]|nr:phosphate ABC transporter substrate-binding protein [Oscillatoriales cyanobacterium RM1_1_9]